MSLMNLFRNLAYDDLKHLANENPQSIQNIVRELDQSEDNLSDAFLDSLFGIPKMQQEKHIDYHQLEQTHGHEQFIYEATPYNYIRHYLSLVQPVSQDIIYDLGCGYGRFVFYGGLTTPACYKGVEIVPERIKKAKEIKKRLKLTNVIFYLGNVLDMKYRDGTIFFFFNPFTDDTMSQVIQRLKEIARNHRIKILTWGGGGTNLFLHEQWLSEETVPDAAFISTLFSRLRLFKSK